MSELDELKDCAPIKYTCKCGFVGTGNEMDKHIQDTLDAWFKGHADNIKNAAHWRTEVDRG